MGKNQVMILGARGSIPVSGNAFSKYGGSTSCVLLETESEVILFDAGSGILNLSEFVWKKHKIIHVLISHGHLDHMMGIPMNLMMFDPEIEVIFYAPDVKKVKRALEQLMQPPLWPVGTEVFKAQVRYESLGEEPHPIGEGTVVVSSMLLEHPGDCYAYRVEWGNHNMVYATDCELNQEGCQRMAFFARNTDLFILDAQYTAEEYHRCQGFGHSDIETAVSVIRESGALQGMLFHHAPTHTDEQLDQIESYVKQKGAHIGVAKEGDRIQL